MLCVVYRKAYANDGHTPYIKSAQLMGYIRDVGGPLHHLFKTPGNRPRSLQVNEPVDFLDL